MKYRDNPLVNCPNGNKIFRKITPSESEANIRLIFRKENFIVMRKSNARKISYFQTRRFAADSTQVRQGKTTPYGSKRNLAIVGERFLCLRSFWERKRKEVANGETRYNNKEKRNQPNNKQNYQKPRRPKCPQSPISPLLAL
ncbi:hypothetical protein [Avibacterium gallinarum]|uniref:hypothetical protein n=1 Tax=Avibacterium gallinarum TaxID=755 RepID=UPI0013FDDB91|nr:hypothetical protein [Avibacterium gallinarum]